MTIHRALIAFVGAALALAGSFTASAVVYDLNSVQTVGLDTVDGKAYFTTDFSDKSQFNTPTGTIGAKNDGQHTQMQKVSDLHTVVVDGSSYYAFLLDVSGGTGSTGSNVSIDSIKIFTSKNLFKLETSMENYGKLQFNLDGSQDASLQYLSGSGSGDIALFIPTSALADVSPNDYFYLSEKFGSTAGTI